MNDLIYLGITAPFSSSPGSMSTAARTSKHATMETILVGLIALALLSYLTVAMLRPEKF